MSSVSQMTIDSVLGFTVAALVAAGGAAGYIKARSVPSLIAGVGSGVVIAYGITRVRRSPKDTGVVVAASLLLLSQMGKKYLASGKFMPAGLVSLYVPFLRRPHCCG